MALEHKPLHVRKRIALIWTVVIGVLLIALLLIVYIGGNKRGNENDAAGKISNFYKTLVSNTQSYFEKK